MSFILMIRRPPRSTRTDTLFPYPTLFRSLIELPVVRPSVIETSCFGAAWAAGVATGFWHRATLPDSLLGVDRQWRPVRTDNWRVSMMQQWDKAVSRASGWI